MKFSFELSTYTSSEKHFSKMRFDFFYINTCQVDRLGRSIESRTIFFPGFWVFSRLNIDIVDDHTERYRSDDGSTKTNFSLSIGWLL